MLPTPDISVEVCEVSKVLDRPKSIIKGVILRSTSTLAYQNIIFSSSTGSGWVTHRFEIAMNNALFMKELNTIRQARDLGLRT